MVVILQLFRLYATSIGEFDHYLAKAVWALLREK